MTLLEALQQVNKTSMESAQLTDMVAGTVTSESPLEISIDVHQAPLREQVLIMTDAVSPISGDDFFTDVNGELCAIWGQSGHARSLKTGDKVLMLSVRHGQQYIVLSRL